MGVPGSGGCRKSRRSKLEGSFRGVGEPETRLGQSRAPASQRGRRRKKPLRERQTLRGQGEFSQVVTVVEMPGQAGVWRGAKGNRDLPVLKITRGPTPTFRGKKEKGSEIWAEKQNLQFCLFSWSLGSYHSPPPSLGIRLEDHRGGLDPPP